MRNEAEREAIAELISIEDSLGQLRRTVDGADNDYEIKEARKLLNLAKNAVEEARSYLEDWCDQQD